MYKRVKSYLCTQESSPINVPRSPILFTYLGNQSYLCRKESSPINVHKSLVLFMYKRVKSYLCKQESIPISVPRIPSLFMYPQITVLFMNPGVPGVPGVQLYSCNHRYHQLSFIYFIFAYPQIPVTYQRAKSYLPMLEEYSCNHSSQIYVLRSPVLFTYPRRVQSYLHTQEESSPIYIPKKSPVIFTYPRRVSSYLHTQEESSPIYITKKSPVLFT